MFSRALRNGIELKLFEDRHAESLFEAVDRDRTYLREWLQWVDPTRSVEDIRNFIKMSLNQFANQEGLAAGIWQGPRCIGSVGSHKIDWLNRKLEFGYWIAQEFQGRGIMTEASSIFIDHAFQEWKMHRVEIHCATGNVRSCAIPKRLGFRLDGAMRESHLLNGQYVDIYVFGLLAREWNAAEASR
jgi:ribosomal-protein-serine acetyltransferase